MDAPERCTATLMARLPAAGTERLRFRPRLPACVPMPATMRVMVCWPLVPGATSYSLLDRCPRAANTRPDATEFVAPVCGSGAERAV